MDNRTELEALRIAVKVILASANMSSSRKNLTEIAENKINHGISVGEIGNFERGVGAQLINLLKEYDKDN